MNANRTIVSFYGRMGMTVQTRKCTISASTRQGRKFFRLRSRRGTDGAFSVSQALRDLGAHLNLTKGWGLGLQTKRIGQVLQCARDLSKLHAPLGTVCKVIKGKLCPAALYAASSSHVPVGCIRALESAFASAILNGAGRQRAPALVLAFCGSGLMTMRGTVAMERMLCLRRFVFDDAVRLSLVHNIHQQHLDGKHTRPCGPVGLLISSFRELGLRIAPGLTIGPWAELNAPVLEGPANVLKAIVREASIQAAVSDAAARRPTLGGAVRAQTDVTLRQLDKLDDSDRRLMMHVIAGGVWTPDVLHRAGLRADPVCRMCGGSGTLAHFSGIAQPPRRLELTLVSPAMCLECCLKHSCCMASPLPFRLCQCSPTGASTVVVGLCLMSPLVRMPPASCFLIPPSVLILMLWRMVSVALLMPAPSSPPFDAETPRKCQMYSLMEALLIPLMSAPLLGRPSFGQGGPRASLPLRAASSNMSRLMSTL